MAAVPGYPACPTSYASACLMRLGRAVWLLALVLSAASGLIGVMLAAFAVQHGWVLCLPCFAFAIVTFAVGWLVRKVLVG